MMEILRKLFFVIVIVFGLGQIAHEFGESVGEAIVSNTCQHDIHDTDL